MHIRPLGDADLDAVLALNNAEVPRLGRLADHAELRALRDRSDLAVVAEDTDGDAPGLLGFLVAVAPGSDYGSANYRFFERRGTDHLYVDRVAVAPHARRRGVAARLYDAVEERARTTGRREVTCEVNLRPRNEGSLAFHARRGFVEVAQQDTGSLRVALLAKPLDPSGPDAAIRARH